MFWTIPKLCHKWHQGWIQELTFHCCLDCRLQAIWNTFDEWVFFYYLENIILNLSYCTQTHTALCNYINTTLSAYPTLMTYNYIWYQTVNSARNCWVKSPLLPGFMKHRAYHRIKNDSHKSSLIPMIQVKPSLHWGHRRAPRGVVTVTWPRWGVIMYFCVEEWW